MDKKQQETMDLYAGLMEEIKIRIAAIESTAKGATGLRSILGKEFCYLQLRMICELIALGCMVAHGDIRDKKKSLQTIWAADRISHELGQLHKDFYPKPITPVTQPNGVLHLADKTGDTLSKSDLEALYVKCGARLHKGSIKRLLSDQPSQTPIHFIDVIESTNKIIHLLETHLIALFDKSKLYICSLSNKDNGGRVQVAFAESPEV